MTFKKCDQHLLHACHNHGMVLGAGNSKRWPRSKGTHGLKCETDKNANGSILWKTIFQECDPM